MDPLYLARNALAVLLVTGFIAAPALAPASGPGEARLEQRWTDADRQQFYSTSQGSRMLLYDWFRALEVADGPGRFDADGLRRYGYLRSPFDDELPIGFALDGSGRGDWVGPTCSACHVGAIAFDGRTMRIDGAPSGADLLRLLSDLRDALEATASARHGARFERFANRVLGAKTEASARDELYEELLATASDWTAFVDGSAPPQPWGPGRADGFGLLFNRLFGLALGRAENIRALEAPVSYPHLWGSSFQSRAQWNGSADNFSDVDRLGRNLGQALGNFVHVNLRRPGPQTSYYRSSARRQNMLALEELLKRLGSPVWPEEILGPIDAERAAAGEILYQSYCASCHTPITANPPRAGFDVTMVPVHEVGTDPSMAWDYCSRTANPARLEGASLHPLIGKPLPNPVTAHRFLQHVVAGTLLSPQPYAREFVDETAGQRFDSTSQDAATSALVAPTACDPDDDLMRYKATSLQGVWATAPYLHNGAVVSLYELLLPPEQRRTAFWVGTRRYDPVHVGFDPERRAGATRLDTTLRGNSRLGHDYATRVLSDAERWQLLEYLKTR